MATIFLEDRIKDKDLNGIIELLKENKIKYQVKEKECYSKLIIDNNEVGKLEFGVGKSRGKTIIYDIPKEKSMLIVNNSYGWNGTGMPYSTDNSIKPLNKTSISINNFIYEYRLDKSLIEIERGLRTTLGLENIVRKVTKYENLEDFANSNPNLLKKYILQYLEKSLLLLDINNLKDFIRYDNRKNRDNEYKVLIDIKEEGDIKDLYLRQRTEDKDIKELFKKINSKLENNIYSISTKDLMDILCILNIPFQHMELNLGSETYNLALKIGEPIKGFEKLNEIIKNLNKKEEIIVSLKNNEIEVKINNMVDLFKELEDLEGIKVSKEKLSKILKIINS